MNENVVKAVDAFLADAKRKGKDGAALIGIHPATLARRQKHPGEYRLQELAAISEATRIPIEVLLGGKKC